MNMIWLRNEIEPILKEHEVIGPPHQSTFIDPIANTGFVHKGREVEELKRERYVGVYIPLDKWKGN